MSALRHWCCLALMASMLFAMAAPPGLQPPTSDVYADVALYTLEELTTSSPGEEPGWVEVTLGALHASGSDDPRSIGLYQAVVEIYVDDGEVGFSDLLPGSGLQMATGRGWRDAVRITHEGAFVWHARRVGGDAGLRLVGMEGPQAVTVERRDRTLRIQLPSALPAGARVYAISGVHDPFAASGWRALAPAPAPFAFAAEDPSRPPIIGLLPGDEAAYLRVVEGGVLGGRAPWQFRGVPLPEWPVRGWRWWSLTAVGLLVFGLGTLLLRRARRRATVVAPAHLPVRSRKLAGRDPQARSLELIAEEDISKRA